MDQVLSEKQIEFIRNSRAKWNLAHGSVRCGKTICTAFRFLQAVIECPDTQCWMVGKTSSTIYDNVIRLILEPPAPGRPDPFVIFRPLCSWFKHERELRVGDKKVSTAGAKDEGALGIFAGKTMSVLYCDEMTLYPDSIIEMLSTRLSNPHSIGFASMNPSHPNHIIKKWIDKAAKGDRDYYELKFTLDDNPFVEDSYKARIKNSLSGVFYKRNYLGLWCLAEGAIFDFFDRKVNVKERPPRAAEYFVAGIDVGTVNAFACIVMGVSTGKYAQEGKALWAEAEYYWDSRKEGRQKTNGEYAEDLKTFLAPYGLTSVFIDPSAAAMKEDLRRKGFHPIDANNDVNYGIETISSMMKAGTLTVLDKCPNLIREIESYVWNPKEAEKGYDEPLKKDDHAIDAFRYIIATHKPSTFDLDSYYRKKQDEMRQKHDPFRRPF